MKKCWLQNKTVLITGGASGIGAGIARLLITKYACKVIAVIIDDAGLEQTVRELGENSGNFTCLYYDVSRYENWIKIKKYLEDNSVQVDILLIYSSTMRVYFPHLGDLKMSLKISWKIV